MLRLWSDQKRTEWGERENVRTDESRRFLLAPRSNCQLVKSVSRCMLGRPPPSRPPPKRKRKKKKKNRIRQVERMQYWIRCLSHQNLKIALFGKHFTVSVWRASKWKALHNELPWLLGCSVILTAFWSCCFFFSSFFPQAAVGWCAAYFQDNRQAQCIIYHTEE